MSAETSPEPERPSGGVQSIERAFTLLEIMATNEGVMGVSQLAVISGYPLPTIHRAIRTLVNLGYVRQEPSRRYALGPRLLLLAEASSSMLNGLAVPYLRRLVDSLGETANLAILDGDQVAYVAQVPGRHSMRMFTEVGRRVLPHCTAVGKALLADTDDAEIRAILRRTGMPRHTDHTITDADEYIRQMDIVRGQHFAIDEGEQEVGVRCVAVAIPHPTVRLALSVSGPAPRVTNALVDQAVPILTRTAADLAADLG
jgi:IclR family acetate operon transcriptional repressor